METILHFFRTYPEMAIFLTIGIGFWLGQLKYKSFFKKESGDGIITFTATPAARWPLVQETGLQGEKNPGDGGAHQVG